MALAQTIHTEFQQMNDQVSELYKKQDFKGIAETFYAKDCHRMVPGMEATIGREDTWTRMKSYYEKGYSMMKFTTLEVVPGGEAYATDRGSYTWYNKDGVVSDEGKFVTLRRKEDGKWVFYFIIYNSNKA